MTQADPALAVQATIVEALKRQLDAVAAAVARRPAPEFEAQAEASGEAAGPGAERAPAPAPAKAKAKATVGTSPTPASGHEGGAVSERSSVDQPAPSGDEARVGSAPAQSGQSGRQEAGRASPWSAPLRLRGPGGRDAARASKGGEPSASAAKATPEAAQRAGEGRFDVEWGEVRAASRVPAGSSSSSIGGAEEFEDRELDVPARPHRAASPDAFQTRERAPAEREAPASRRAPAEASDDAPTRARASAPASAWSRPLRLGSAKPTPAARQTQLPRAPREAPPAAEELELAEATQRETSRPEPEASPSLSSFGAVASPSPFSAADPRRDTPRARASARLGARRAAARADEAPTAILAPAPSLDDELDSLGELEERLADVLEGVLFEMGVEP